jgi:hypothetical protein
MIHASLLSDSNDLTLSPYISDYDYHYDYRYSQVRGVYIRPYIFAFLVVLGLVPCSHWAYVTPVEYRQDLNMVIYECINEYI